jgi:hypothetical protein
VIQIQAEAEAVAGWWTWTAKLVGHVGAATVITARRSDQTGENQSERE